MVYRVRTPLQKRRLAQRFLVLLAIAIAGWIGWNRFARPSTSQMLQQALRLAERGDGAASMRLFDEVLRRNPSDGKALLYRGQLARDAGDSAAAVRFWAQVPDSPLQTGARTRYLEGLLFLKTGRARDAEGALLRSVVLNPQAIEPHEQLLLLYSTQLRPREINRELTAIRRFRDWKLEELYKLANVAGEAANRQQAIPHLERYLAVDRNDLASRIALGRYYVWDDRPDQAAVALRSALARNPNDSTAQALLVEAFLAQSDRAAARDVVQGMTTGRDSSAFVWRSLGGYGASAGEWQLAAACLARAVEMQPYDRSAVYQLAVALDRMGDAANGSRFYHRAQLLLELKTALHKVVLAPGNRPGASIAAVSEAADLLVELGRFEIAVPFFEQVLAWDPHWPDARARRDMALRSAQAQHDAQPSADAESDQFLEAALAAVPGLMGVSPGTPGHSHVSPIEPSIRFVDRHVAAGIDFQFFNGAEGLKYLLETTGGGVGVIDYDGDGRPDLFFPQGCRIPHDSRDTSVTDRLYRNRGDGTFVDVTSSTGLDDNQFSQGCAAADYDNDGFADLAVANCGTNRLYHNNGDGTFSDISGQSGIAGAHWSTSFGWGDLDRDGNLDLYVVNYVTDPLQVCRNSAGRIILCHPQLFEAEQDILYASRGDGTFADATRDSGLEAPHGRGLGVVIADLNDDGWPEVYVANDGNPCFLFHNLGSTPSRRFRFEEVGFASGTAISARGNATAAMGIACADLNADGRLDLFVTNFNQDADILYLNHGDLVFEDACQRAGLVESTKPMLGWGAQAIDADLDGWPEIFLTNGHLDDRRDEGIPWKMPAQLFYNLGAGRFQDISRDCGEFFGEQSLGRGVARLDWNGDGLSDLIVVHHDRPVALLQNVSERTGHRLVVELHGVQSNRDAIGARLQVKSGGHSQIVELCGGDGYCATNEHKQIIGLGAAELAELQVSWPSGRIDRWPGIRADTSLTLIEGRPPIVKPIATD